MHAGGPEPPRVIRPVALVLLASLCASTVSAEPEPEPLVPAPLPQIASVVPGVLIHGSGTFLQGRTQTTNRLLLMEGTGVGLTLLGGVALITTGASRRVVGPAALTAMTGVNLFALSLLSSLYASAAPREGLGVPRRELALLESSLGYLYVYDPQFAFHHFATLGVDARIGPWHLGADSAVAPRQGNSRWKLLGGYRFLGPRGPHQPPASDGSYLELELGLGDHYYGDDEFTSRVLELGLGARLDSQRYLPDVRGAFFQLGAGFAKQWLLFDLPGEDVSNDTSLLLAHFGFGMYLGDAATRGGELELYYDHRHDGFAAGLKINGLGSGVAGHFGLRGSYTISPEWAVSAMTEIGSAWVLGTSVTWRTDGP
jgi:hypothetical protein